MAGMIISGVTFGLAALIMIGIGISQLKSRNPVGFYTGEKPPKKEQLSDVNAWNREHGTMWIVYGLFVMGIWIFSALIGDTIYSVIPLVVGVPASICFMVLYHHNLVKKYFIK